MNKALRPAVVAGNWKMNKTPAQAAELLGELVPLVGPAPRCTVVVCPPFVCLPAAARALDGKPVALGAQNCHFAQSGAYTGEVSAPMLTALGCEYVIIGHSERRQYFGDTDETVAKRAAAALDAGLHVILCVGETLEQRENGETFPHIDGQLQAALAGLPAAELSHLIIAYEPIWAIGTGRTATADQAQEVCAHVRGVVAQMFGRQIADGLPVLYGGSMNAGNARELLDMEDIDGGLCGGASLKPAEFAAIVAIAGK